MSNFRPFFFFFSDLSQFLHVSFVLVNKHCPVFFFVDLLFVFVFYLSLTVKHKFDSISHIKCSYFFFYNCKMELIWNKVDFPKRHNGEGPGNLYMNSRTPPYDHLIIIRLFFAPNELKVNPVISLILQPH